jgi:hypothetical protein
MKVSWNGPLLRVLFVALSLVMFMTRRIRVVQGSAEAAPAQ